VGMKQDSTVRGLDHSMPAQAREELRKKTTTLGEDLAGIFGSGLNALACCVAHDPDKANKRQERQQTLLDSQRRGVTGGFGRQPPQLVGVGVILNHTSRHGIPGGTIRDELGVDSIMRGRQLRL